MEGATVAAGSRQSLSAPLRVLGDEALVRLAKRGNQAAFSAIFDRHHQALFKYALTILANREDAFDAVQNAIVKLLRTLPGEQRDIKLKPWLFRIVHNEAISIIRQRGPRAEVALDEISAEDSPDDRMRAQAIIADLSLLGEQQRSAVAMRELNGLSHAEIAHALGISETAAKQSVYEGRLALQQIEEGREMGCAEIQRSISANDRRLIKGRRVRSHLRSCAVCSAFEGSIAHRRMELAAIAPLSAVLSGKLLAGALGGGGGPAGGLTIGAATGAGAAHAVGAGTLAKLGASAALLIGGGFAVESQVDKSKATPEGGNGAAPPALTTEAAVSTSDGVPSPERGAHHREVASSAVDGGHGGGSPKQGDPGGRGPGGTGQNGGSKDSGGGQSDPADGSPPAGSGGNGGSGGVEAGNGGSGNDGGEGNGGGSEVAGGAQGDGGDQRGGDPVTPPESDDEVEAVPPAHGHGASHGHGAAHGNGPAHGQEVVSSHDPGHPGNSAGHSQSPASPPGLGDLPDVPDLPDLPDLPEAAGGLGHGHGLK